MFFPQKKKVSVGTLFVGAFAGAYFGLALVIFLMAYELPSNTPLVSFYFKTVAASFHNLIEFFVIFGSFTALGVAIAYSITIAGLLKKTATRLDASLDVNRSKDEFISMVLHHLRTPLSGMRWSLKEILQEGSGNKEQQKKLSQLYEENNRALGAVDHLVEASQASMGKIAYQLEVISIKDLLILVKEGIQSMEARARAKNLSVAIDTHPASEHAVKVDKEKIIVVIQTLFENAISYTLKGGAITIRTEEKQSGFFFHILDTGIGIPAEDQSRVFLQFFRSESGRRMEPGGFGIGLFLAKSFIEGHQGKVWFDSQEGKGTTFSFMLPIIEVPTEKFLEKL